MPRLATLADVNFAAQLLEDFQRSVGNADFAVDRARVAKRIQQWPHIQGIDDLTGVYCELKVSERRHEAEFSAAFPRGAGRGMIGPVFAFCARQAIVLLTTRGSVGPLRVYTLIEVRAWRVFGEFLFGLDDKGLPDGGRAIAQAWVDYFTAAGKPISKTPDGRIPQMLLGDLADLAL